MGGANATTFDPKRFYPKFENTNDLEELLARVLHDRDHSRQSRPDAHGHISNAGVARLIRLAYFTSMMREEGEYPRFRIAVVAVAHGAKMTGMRDEIFRFNPAIVLDRVDDLRRLTPSVATHELAFEVVESPPGKTLHCTGIRRGFSDDAANRVFSATPWAHAIPYGLLIRVDAPGFVRVRENHSVYSLQPDELLTMGNVPIGGTTAMAASVSAQSRHE